MTSKENKNTFGNHKPKSEETRKKMSISAIKRSKNPEYKLKQSIAQKENRRLHPMSKKQRDQISKARTGAKASQVTKEKMSKKRKGRVPWNKGKHTLTEETKEQYRQQGKERWGNMTDEQRQSHMLKMHIGAVNKRAPRISKPQMELYQMIKQVYPEAELEHLIYTKTSFCFADIALPSLKVAIEYDGKHWHEKQKEKDSQRDRDLAEVGWATFRIDEDSLKVLSRQKNFTFVRKLN